MKKILLVALMALVLVLPLAALADTVYENTPIDTPTAFAQSPALDDKVAAGELPAVADRLPEEPLVIPPVEEIGQYGGTLYLYAPSVDGFDDMHWTRRGNWTRTAANAYFYEGENSHVPYRVKSIVANDDLTEFTVTLRKGVKWSDGVECTVDDVIFTLDYVWGNEKLGTYFTFWMDNRPTYERVDDYTLTFIFENPCTDFMSRTAGAHTDQGFSASFAETPAHYMKQFHIDFNENADEEAKAQGYEDWSAMYVAMANCGGGDQINLELPTVNPWILVSKTTTQRVYERNPYYWAVDTAGNQLPYIDKMVVEAVSDTEVAKIKLLAGEYDLQGQFLIELNEYPMLKQNEQSGDYGILLCKGSYTAKPAIAFNLNSKDAAKRELYNTPDFRKALSYAIDREEISEVVFQGLAKGMQDVFMLPDNDIDPTEWLYAYTEYDPDKAGEMLDALGMTIGADGYRTLPDGSPFSFQMQTIAEEGWANAAELVAAQWQKIGINAVFAVVDRTPYHERIAANEFDVWIWHDGIMTERGAYTSWGQWSYNEKAWGWYYDMRDTEHELREDTPDDYREHYENTIALMAAPYGSDEYMELLKKVWDFRIDQLYVIGTVGDYPMPLLVKNGLKNVGNLDVPFDTWKGQFVEQMYWADDARRAE